jgi:hypothetical protein
MRRVLPVIFSLVAAGCGSGEAPDYAPNFAGIWNGTATETDSTGALLGSYGAQLNFEETSRSELKFYNACTDNNGPYIQATSDTEFSLLASYTCNAMLDGQCGSATITWETLTGDLNGSSIEFTAKLSAALCGGTQSLGLSFSGTR